MSSSSSAGTNLSSTAGDFHFTPQNSNSPLHSPISTAHSTKSSPTLAPIGTLGPTSTSRDPSPSSSPGPAFAPSTASNKLPPPQSSAFPSSFGTDGDSFLDRQRRVSYADGAIGSSLGSGDIWGGPTTQRTTRAASEGFLLTGSGLRLNSGLRSPGAGLVEETEAEAEGDELSAFRELQQRNLQQSANLRLAQPLISPTSNHTNSSYFHIQNSKPLLSPTSNGSTPTLSPPLETVVVPAGASSSLHLGDLDVWMDEAYVRECCVRMGWEGVTSIKIIRGASPSSGYCFLTFPSPQQAAQVLAKFNTAPPTLMPRSGRTFKLNWGTGLPGVQPRWEGEHSVFVGDLGRDVGEAELVQLFTPLFPSTKSAKIMNDPSTGASRGYGFVRFADEADMNRALSLGQNAGSGLSLHGRTLRISEASGPGSDGSARERSRTRSTELSIHTGSNNHFNQTNPEANAYPDFLSPTFPVPYTPSPLSPSVNSSGPRGAPLSPSNDPNNTTVFVGGLPACISEETLKSFFHHFGEITYCKIPTNKGCGFVQFVRRADAEVAIAKMNDFPIHGKSRIRLSWGRSQGDKQVEQVRKLATALGIPFEAVWKMVQGQDGSTIKQIASAVTANQPQTQHLAHGQRQHRVDNTHHGGGPGMDLGAVATAAGLSEAEVLEIVSGRQASKPISGSNDHSNGSYGRAQHNSFASFTPGMPLSPPPSANGHSFGSFSPPFGGPPHLAHQAFGGSPSPYNAIRPDSYLVQTPTSPYERVDFAEGGLSPGMNRHLPGQAYQSYVPPPRYGAQSYDSHHHHSPAQHGGFDQHQTFSSLGHGAGPLSPVSPGGSSGLEDAFSHLSFGAQQQQRAQWGTHVGSGWSNTRAEA